MSITNRSYLLDKVSKFQKRDNKRIYEDTIKKRLDPKSFSTYKQYVPPEGITTDILEYVENNYADEGYFITYNKFSNPGDPI